MLLYTRTKGKAENEITAVCEKGLTIYRPGLLQNRRNDERFMEKVGDWVPFIPKIQAVDMGAAMIEGALLQIANPSQTRQVLTNAQIKDMLAGARKQ